MKGELVVVFVLVNPATRKYLGPMGFAQLGDEYQVAALTEDGFSFVSDDGDLPAVDVILLPDRELTEESESALVLRGQAGEKERIFVAYHTSSKSKGLQQAVLKEIFRGKLVSPPLNEHHDSGKIYDALMNLSGCRDDPDKERYRVALAHLISCFTGNAELEARLELLHLCLTPEGALQIIQDQFPEHIPEDIRVRISELINEEKDGRTIRSMIEKLAAPGSDPFNASAGGYVDQLKAIRAAILEETSTAEDDPGSSS